MKLTQEDAAQIETIMSSMDCQKGFRCYQSGFDNICPASQRGLEMYADCRDASNAPCEFRIPFGHGAFCKCPLRVFIANYLHK